jgi:hypothetical protein
MFSKVLCSDRVSNSDSSKGIKALFVNGDFFYFLFLFLFWLTDEKDKHELFTLYNLHDEIIMLRLGASVLRETLGFGLFLGWVFFFVL